MKIFKAWIVTLAFIQATSCTKAPEAPPPVVATPAPTVASTPAPTPTAIPEPTAAPAHAAKTKASVPAKVAEPKPAATPMLDCTVSEFNPPKKVTLSGGLKIPVSWKTTCAYVSIKATSGSYIQSFVGASSGNHTFIAEKGSKLSKSGTTVELTFFASDKKNIISKTVTIPITDVTAAPENQCKFSSLTATPNPADKTYPITTLYWATPAGCTIHIEAWNTGADGLTTKLIPKPDAQFFNATDSITLLLTGDTTFYLTSQGGADATAVVNAKTLDVPIR